MLSNVLLGMSIQVDMTALASSYLALMALLIHDCVCGSYQQDKSRSGSVAVHRGSPSPSSVYRTDRGR